MVQIQEVKVVILFTSSLWNKSKYHWWKKDLAVCRHEIIREFEKFWILSEFRLGMTIMLLSAGKIRL